MNKLTQYLARENKHLREEIKQLEHELTKIHPYKTNNPIEELEMKRLIKNKYQTTYKQIAKKKKQIENNKKRSTNNKQHYEEKQNERRRWN
mgnify:CR=1 FL=1